MKDLYRKSSEWFRDYFGEDYFEIYTEFIVKDKDTEREIKFVGSLLEGLPDGYVLDLACGYGRHLTKLEKKRFVPVGLDNNLKYLTYAKKNAAEKNRASLISGDMRHLPFSGDSFIAVYSLFTSFGYFIPKVSGENRFPRDENVNILKEPYRIINLIG